MFEYIAFCFFAAVNCGSIRPVPHLFVHGTAFVYPNRILFSCPAGFDLVGAKQLSCLANGSWSSSTPICKAVTCPHLLRPPFGSISSSNFSFSSVVKFRCASGFVLNGSSSLACSATRRWNASVPRCHPVKCPHLHAPPHSQIVSQNNSFLGHAVAACLLGYQHAGGDAIRQCRADRQWSGERLYCQGECLVMGKTGRRENYVQ